MSAICGDPAADPWLIVADLRRRLDARSAELDEVSAQQVATTEILQVINSSPGDLTPVFDALLEKVMRPCEAAFGLLWTYDGASLHAAATSRLPAALAEFVCAPHLPGPKSALGRLLSTKDVVHIGNYLADQAYLSVDDKITAFCNAVLPLILADEGQQ